MSLKNTPPTDAPPTDAPPTDAPPTDAPPTDAPDAKDTRIAELEAERDELRDAQAKPLAPAPVGGTKVPTSADLRTYTDSQWETLETGTGMERKDILAGVERHEIMDSNENTNARLNVQDALDTEIEKDATVGKLKGGIKEYMGGVPRADLADPNKVAAHMKRAKTYARGLIQQSNPAVPPAPGGKIVTGHQPPPPTGDEPGDGLAENEVKPGTEVQIDNLKLKVADKVSDDVRKRSKHPTDPNGAMFKNFDPPPKFNRG